MKALLKHPVGRHLLLILAIKTIALFAIWFVFFSDAPEVDAERTGKALLTPRLMESP